MVDHRLHKLFVQSIRTPTFLRLYPELAGTKHGTKCPGRKTDAKTGDDRIYQRITAQRIGVASQIRFLELAAKALNDPVLGFRLMHDADLRRVGLLYYVAASSETLGDALERAQRYGSIVNAGVVLN